MQKIILVVDDDPRNLKLARDLLLVKGFISLEATNGKEAVEVAKNYRPNLILMDIQMPIMDGIQATKIIKSDPITRHIPIIALTAYAMKGDREKAIEAGCDSYITKPIRIKEFLDDINHFLEISG